MEPLPVINLIYQIYKEIIEINTKLDKRWRYGLGISTENSAIECFELLIMAKKAPKPLKASYLIQANAKHEIIIHKIRLLIELKIINVTRAFQVQAKLTELGRMLGGWLKSVQ